MSRKTALGLVAALLIATPVAAEPITLKLNSPAPPWSYVNKRGAHAVGGSRDRRFRRHAQGADLLWRHARLVRQHLRPRGRPGGRHRLHPARRSRPARFKQQDVAALPFEAENAILASTALWSIYQKGVTTKEFDAVKPLGLWTFPNAAIHSREPIRTLDDFKGQQADRLQRDRRQDRRGARRNADQLPPRRGLYGDPARHHRRRADAVHRHGDVQDPRGDQVSSRRRARQRRRDAVHEPQTLRRRCPPRPRQRSTSIPTCGCRAPSARRPTTQWQKSRNLVKDTVVTLTPAAGSRVEEAARADRDRMGAEACLTAPRCWRRSAPRSQPPRAGSRASLSSRG